MDKISNKYFILLIYAALALAVIIAYEQVRHSEFVYDDSIYVTQNPNVNGGISRQSVIWAFTTSHAGNWHPLTWFSLMLDCELFESKSLACHVTNVLFHIANTLLLFMVLRRMTGAAWPSAFVAALFALHPLHVESVAWVAERKDVLSGFFWMLTIAAYVRYARRPGIGRYLPVGLFLALGLMAKPMLVTLPFVLLLLDYWPLGRLQWDRQSGEDALPQSESVKVGYQKATVLRLIAEKIPLFILVAASGVVTYIVQQSAGAMKTGEKFSLIVRISNALVSYFGYIVKMLYPRRLALLYPHPGDTLSVWKLIVCLVILIVISAVIIFAARRKRYLAVGWLWYLGTLVPVIGLIQVGSQAMADRYTYLPLVGLYIMVAWGGAELFAGWRYRRVTLAISAALLLIVLLICTHRQVSHWQNNLTLYGRAVAVTKNNAIMHNNLGRALLNKGRLDEAIIQFDEALRIKPGFLVARENIGLAFLKRGRLDEGIINLTAVLRVRPDWPEGYNNLGAAYDRQGKYELAIKNYNEALRLKRDWPEVYNNLGVVYTRLGKYEPAIKNYNEALRVRPDWPEIYNNLGLVYARQGMYELAIQNYNQALRIKQDWPEVIDKLAMALKNQGKYDDAIKKWQEAARLAASLGKKELAQKIQKRIEQYKIRRPHRKPSPEVYSD